MTFIFFFKGLVWKDTLIHIGEESQSLLSLSLIFIHFLYFETG